MYSRSVPSTSIVAGPSVAGSDAEHPSLGMGSPDVVMPVPPVLPVAPPDESVVFAVWPPLPPESSVESPSVAVPEPPLPVVVPPVVVSPPPVMVEVEALLVPSSVVAAPLALELSPSSVPVAGPAEEVASAEVPPLPVDAFEELDDSESSELQAVASSAAARTAKGAGFLNECFMATFEAIVPPCVAKQAIAGTNRANRLLQRAICSSDVRFFAGRDS